MTDVFSSTVRWAHDHHWSVVHFSEIDSTNTFAKREFSTWSLNARPQLILAQKQTQGRGRGANLWLNSEPAGSALFLSFCSSVAKPPQPILTPRLGLALYLSALEIWPQLPWSLKAPNDLYLGSLKCAGLLTEVVSQAEKFGLIVGLGMNVLKAPDLASAGSINDQHPLTETEWRSFLTTLCGRLEHLLLTAQQVFLDQPTRTALKDALNRRPNLSSPILDIDQEGRIQTAKGVLPWL